MSSIRCPHCGSTDFYTNEIKVRGEPPKIFYECRKCRRFWKKGEETS